MSWIFSALDFINLLSLTRMYSNFVKIKSQPEFSKQDVEKEIENIRRILEIRFSNFPNFLTFYGDFNIQPLLDSNIINGFENRLLKNNIDVSNALTNEMYLYQ